MTTRLFSHNFEHREYLGPEDFAHAEKMVREGVSVDTALWYLKGWASDRAHEAHADSMAARDFEDRAYGFDYD